MPNVIIITVLLFIILTVSVEYFGIETVRFWYFIAIEFIKFYRGGTFDELWIGVHGIFYDVFTTIDIIGTPCSSPCIFVSNHHMRCFLDSLALVFVPQRVKFVTKQMTEYDFYLRLCLERFKDLNMVMEKQQKTGNYKNIAHQFKNTFDAQQSSWIFPEGRALSNDPFRMFALKSSVFRIAWDHKIPIQPFLTDPGAHTYTKINTDKFRVAFLPLIDPKNYLNFEHLQQAVFQKMQAQLDVWVKDQS
jgi:1-acyl-sn-glycerol-3-phosphate acyltransferase